MPIPRSTVVSRASSVNVFSWSLLQVAICPCNRGSPAALKGPPMASSVAPNTPVHPVAIAAVPTSRKSRRFSMVPPTVGFDPLELRRFIRVQSGKRGKNPRCSGFFHDAAEQPGKRERPGRERDVQERARDNEQRRFIDHHGDTKRAHGVHPERKHGAPVQRVVAQRKTAIDVPPDTQNDEHRNPPRGGRPEEQRQPLDEWEEIPKEW